MMDGGGQERGLRPGTLNVPGIVGFGPGAASRGPRWRTRAAARRACGIACSTGLRSRRRRDHGERRARGAPAGQPQRAASGIDGEALLVSLDDIAVSSGAACTAAEPSHVLGARACRGTRRWRRCASASGGRRPPRKWTTPWRRWRRWSLLRRTRPSRESPRGEGMAMRLLGRRARARAEPQRVGALPARRRMSAPVKRDVEDGTARIQVRVGRTDCRGAVQGVRVQRGDRGDEAGGRVARRGQLEDAGRSPRIAGGAPGAAGGAGHVAGWPSTPRGRPAATSARKRNRVMIEITESAARVIARQLAKNGTGRRPADRRQGRRLLGLQLPVSPGTTPARDTDQVFEGPAARRSSSIRAA